MREIVLDTESTGLDPTNDRIVEVGCVELVNHIPSGRTFHVYVNPGRPVSVDAVRVHGLDDAFLKDKPTFSAVVDELVAFLGDAPLIAHNAEFDLAFLNAELTRCGKAAIPVGRMVDSLMLARRKHPAGPNSLEALCRRYIIDTSRRTFHGALLDAELLSEVYIELIGGRQASLVLGEDHAAPAMAAGVVERQVAERPVPRAFRVTAEELAAHRAGIDLIGTAAIWLSYLEPAPTEAVAG